MYCDIELNSYKVFLLKQLIKEFIKVKEFIIWSLFIYKIYYVINICILNFEYIKHFIVFWNNNHFITYYYNIEYNSFNNHHFFSS